MGFFQPTAQLVSDMRRREGSSLKVYPDSKGLATQGVGRHHGIQFGAPDIDEATEWRWLAEDMQSAYATAETLFDHLDEIDVVRRESLIDCAFNMGALTLAQFTPFIAAVNARDWPSAHLHLLTNTHGHLTPYLMQVGIRAVDVAGRIATGVIPKEFRIG